MQNKIVKELEMFVEKARKGPDPNVRLPHGWGYLLDAYVTARQNIEEEVRHLAVMWYTISTDLDFIHWEIGLGNAHPKKDVIGCVETIIKEIKKTMENDNAE